MKQTISFFLTGILISSLSLIAADEDQQLENVSPQNTFTVKTTAYSHTEDDHLKYGRKAASGDVLKYGKVISAAADWSVWPLGTKFKIKGQDVVYEIDDYGSALVGTRTIDLYRPSKEMIKQWGARKAEIEIIEWGCFHESSAILASRLNKAEHVDDMYASIQARAPKSEKVDSQDSAS